MDFTLSKEHQDIIKAAREFALGEFPERAQEFDRNESFDLDIWRKACELGLLPTNGDSERELLTVLLASFRDSHGAV